MRRLIRQTCIILSVIGLIFLILSNGKDTTKEENKVVGIIADHWKSLELIKTNKKKYAKYIPKK